MVKHRDEFEEADRDVGLEVIDTKKEKGVVPSDMMSYRDNLIKQHHNGAKGLMARLRRDNIADTESILFAMLEEIIGESDNLLGNEMVSFENGELRDASVISFKRAEVLEKAIKALQTKQALEQQSGFDIDSPLVMVIFRYFMAKSKNVFELINMPTEQSDLFFRTLADEMQNWRKEIKSEIGDTKGKKR